MHESLLKGEFFSSRFWGWGRNRSLSPPLPGKDRLQGRCPPTPGPGTPGIGTRGTGTPEDGGESQGSSLPSAPPPPFFPPAASTAHSRPYRDCLLKSRHAERLSGRAARPRRFGDHPARALPIALSRRDSGPGLPLPPYLRWRGRGVDRGCSILPPAPPGPGPGSLFALPALWHLGEHRGDRIPLRLCTERGRRHPGGSPDRGRGSRGRESSRRRVINGPAVSPIGVSTSLFAARPQTSFSLFKLRPLRAKAGTPRRAAPASSSSWWPPPTRPEGSGRLYPPPRAMLAPSACPGIWVSLLQQGTAFSSPSGEPIAGVEQGSSRVRSLTLTCVAGLGPRLSPPQARVSPR